MRNKILLASVVAGMLAAGCGMTALADYKSTVLTDNPSGYWRLNAKPWFNATNSGWAGGAVDGAIGSWTREGIAGAIVGDANTAMQFVGNGNSRVTIPYSADINPDPALGQSFTFEAWVKNESKYGEALGIVVNRSGESGYVIYIQGDGTLAFLLNRGAGGGYWIGTNVLAADAAQMLGKWVHLACVYDNSAGTTGFGTAMIYTNGALCASLEITGALPAVNPNGPMVLGDRNYNGALDEVAVYTNALSPATILAHYQAGTNGSGTYAATILAANPPGYWRLGETAGVAAPPALADNLGSLGPVADGNYVGSFTLQAAGALGTTDPAATFSGGYVAVAQNAAINPGGPFTVEAWMKPATAQTGTGLVCPISSWEELSGQRSGWLIYQSSTGWNLRTYNKNGTTVAVSITGGSAPVIGTWYHVAAVWDGSVGTIYVNGVPTSSTPTNYIPTGYRPFTVGARSDGGFAWAGTQDEVAFYNGALSAGTIMAHYQAAATNTAGYATQILADNPIGYWRLNDTVPAIAFGATNLGYIGAAGIGSYNGGSMVVTNDTPLVGDSDPAMYFPGSSRIDIPLHEALVRTNAFSYEIWYKENPGVSGIRSPMWWRDEPSGGDTRGWVHYLQDLTGGRGHNFQSSSTATTWDGMWVVPLSFVQDQWQHLAVTWDGLVKKIYLDGALVQVSTNDPRYMKLVQRAACSISSGSYPFNGFLDEAAYYTNALSHERVVAHYVAARGANPPIVGVTFLQQPLPVSGFEGSTVTLKTIVLGTLPFSYQWYKDGTTPVAGQTTATLTLTPALVSQTGDYTLWVTNGAGAVSSDIVHVEIVTAPPTIVQEPQPASRLQGASVTFTVVAGGSEPLSYQWKSNTVAIPGATSATLTLANVQPSYAADYSVTVNNTAGTKDSAAAALTVQATTPGSIAATIVSDNPRAYWRLNETTGNIAYDLAGGHDGTYDPGMGMGVPGGVLGDPDKAANFPSYAGIQVPFSAHLNPSAAFTVECWARADAFGNGLERTLFSSRNREQSSNWHFGYYVGVNATDQWLFNTGHKTSGVRGLAGGLADTNWHHIVCTYDDATLTKNLYVDGQLVAFDNPPLNTFAPNLGFGTLLDDPPPTDEGIGATVAADRYSGAGLYFWGDLDEMAVYDYALTPAQVANHYTTAGPPSVFIGSDGANVVVSWNKGLLLQAPAATGPWTTNTTAVSPWTNAPAGTQQFYRALVP